MENKLSVRRCLTFATGLSECLCFAGAVFGWASLVFVLKEDGYFTSLCVNGTEVNGTLSLDCSAQDEQFSLIFTIASFMNNFLTLPNGFLFDHFGTTVTRLYGIFLYTMGTLMVAFSSSALASLLFPALSLLAVGGILFLLTNMQGALWMKMTCGCCSLAARLLIRFSLQMFWYETPSLPQTGSKLLHTPALALLLTVADAPWPYPALLSRRMAHCLRTQRFSAAAVQHDPGQAVRQDLGAPGLVSRQLRVKCRTTTRTSESSQEERGPLRTGGTRAACDGTETQQN